MSVNHRAVREMNQLVLSSTLDSNDALVAHAALSDFPLGSP
jgi:hypothetical protein